MIGDPGDPRSPAARRFGRSQGITVSVLTTLLIVTGVAAFIANRPLSIARQTATASTQTPQGPTTTPVTFAQGNDWPQGILHDTGDRGWNGLCA
jgi:hypothetical protein